MASNTLDILYEDDWLLVVNKPAGIPTMGSDNQVPSLLSLAQRYLPTPPSKQPPFVGLSSRLDLPVAGIVVMAKQPEVAQILTQQYQQHQVEKVYQALVSGEVESASGTCEHWIRKAGIHAKVRVVSPETERAQRACLHYRIIKSYPGATGLEIHLDTGRKHQIRTQLSYVGHPIWGDYKYGSRLEFPQGIALLAQRLSLAHPVTAKALHFAIDNPPYWPNTDAIIAWAASDTTWLERKHHPKG